MLSLFGHLCILSRAEPSHPTLPTRVPGDSVGSRPTGSTASFHRQSALFVLGTLGKQPCGCYGASGVQSTADLRDTPVKAGEVQATGGEGRHEPLAGTAAAQRHEHVNEVARSSESHCPANFTCLFNRRPRQEAGLYNCDAVATATPLLILLHPLAESFQELSEGVEVWGL